MAKFTLAVIRLSIITGIVIMLTSLNSCRDDYDTYIEEIHINPCEFSSNKLEDVDGSTPIDMASFVISGYFITSEFEINDFRSHYYHLNPELSYLKVMVKENEDSEAIDVSSSFKSFPKGLFGSIPVNVGIHNNFEYPLATLREERSFNLALRDSLPVGENTFYVVGVFEDGSEIISNNFSVILK